MARKKSSRKKIFHKKHISLAMWAVLLLCGISGLGLYQLVFAYANQGPVELTFNPNIGVRAQVEEFFTANGAPEMIPIIKCESRFRHYNKDGSVLTNRAGSSATGVTQILASVHPDPKVLEVYNKRHNADLTVEDFDITTIEGNLGYALALYEVRGTRDWECAKKFRFN